MAAASDNRVGRSILRAEPRGFSVPVQLESGVDFYMNTLVGIRTSDGFGEKVTAAGAYNKVGILTASVDTTDDASDGDTTTDDVRVGVLVELVASGMAQDDQGKVVYASDDQTVTLTQGGSEHQIGHIVEVISATSVLVYIDPENA